MRYMMGYFFDYFLILPGASEYIHMFFQGLRLFQKLRYSHNRTPLCASYFNCHTGEFLCTLDIYLYIGPI